MDRDRRLTIVAAVGLLASLWAPWYRETVIARGVTGLRTLSQAMTGWQALSSAGIVCAIVAGAVIIALFARCRPGRRAPAAARDGLIVGIGAGACVVMLVAKLLDHGGATGGGLAEATVAIRWGVVLALACALALAWLGVRMMRPGARPPTPPSDAARSEHDDRPGADGRARRLTRDRVVVRSGAARTRTPRWRFRSGRFRAGSSTAAW